MSRLWIDLTPNAVYSQDQEQCPVDNQIVICLKNPSDQHSVVWHNTSQTQRTEFPTIEGAAAEHGLSALYVRFQLGSDAASLNPTLPQSLQVSVPEEWFFLFCHDDTFVFYPKLDLELEPGGQVEFVFRGLQCQLPPGSTSNLAYQVVNLDNAGELEGGYLPIHKLRHPLCIRKFELTPETRAAGFQDQVTFTWLVLGADRLILSPGDVALTGLTQYSLRLLERTYVLTAVRGDEQVTRPCEIIPLQAGLSQLSGERKGGKVVLSFLASNTRHAFVTQLGRVEVPDGALTTVTLDETPGLTVYRVSVENETGLVSLTCKV